MSTSTHKNRNAASPLQRWRRRLGIAWRRPRAHVLAILTLVAAMTLLATTAHAQLGTSPAAIALELALEHNVQVRAFEQRCGALAAAQRSLIGVIPINQQVLSAAVAYRAELHALDAATTQDLRVRSYTRYLEGDESVFLVFVLNPDRIDPSAFVYLPGSGIRLQDEYQRYQSLRHTPIFDPNRPLGPGMTRGYVYFPSFRDAASESYVIQFDDGYVDLCGTGRGQFVYMALEFDESELDFFDLIQRGMSPDALRRSHGIPTYGERGFSSPQFIDLLNLVINLIGLIR